MRTVTDPPRRHFLLSAVVAAVLIASCTDENYMLYDTSLNGVYFAGDTLSWSFGVTPVDTLTHTVQIPVRIMGTLSDVPRPIGYEIICDTTRATEGVQYRMGQAIIEPDSVTGHIDVVLLREGLEGNYSEGYTTYCLGIRLVENEAFQPVLATSCHTFILRFDNAIEQPSWLDAFGDKVWYESELGVWHPLKFIKMVEYFHDIANVMPETYAKMVKSYGENLEHVPYGSFYAYRTVVRKYIFARMYDYFGDPAYRDAILAAYPDFPFDFPDPYAQTALM